MRPTVFRANRGRIWESRQLRRDAGYAAPHVRVSLVQRDEESLRRLHLIGRLSSLQAETAHQQMIELSQAMTSCFTN
jgi:hypothetical protein